MHLEEAIKKAKEYIASGEHAEWHGFRPLFTPKLREGKALPPDVAWVRKTFLPAKEKALDEAYRKLERLAD